MPPPTKKRYVHILTSGTCACDLIWKKPFADVIKLRISRWDHPGSRWALNPTSVIIGDGRGEDK